MQLVLFPGILACLCFWPVHNAHAQVAIRTDYPGGNVLVVKDEGRVVSLAPDLRGGPAWFYWNFEAQAKVAGPVTFEFPKAPLIGSRGPAISDDDGQSWRWLGADAVEYAPPAGIDAPKDRRDRFTYTFQKAGQKVRFAVAIPYLQSNLRAFLDRHKDNAHLKRTVLTKSRLGKREVDLLQIGKPGPGVRAVLMTARHHACESMASYVLEGIMQEALSDSPFGEDFRKKYVLYVVPIVDVDGVEEGDQGKNRLPRDYNRSYGEEGMYPEIQAITELAELRKIQLSLDIHCPYLRGDIHDAFHFLGYGSPHIKDNLKEWKDWLKEERPQSAMTPLDLLTDSAKPNSLNRTINSHYFATRKGSIFAATLEVPYTQPQTPLDAAMARAYGVGMLRAWTRTQFMDETQKRTDDTHAKQMETRTQFLKLYRSKPKEAEAMALDLQKSDSRWGIHEGNVLLAILALHQKQYDLAKTRASAVIDQKDATAQQRHSATLLQLRATTSDPKTTLEEVEKALGIWRRLDYVAPEQHSQALESVGEYYERTKDLEAALKVAREQFTVIAGFEKGRVLNRAASLLDALKRSDEAIKTRQETAKLLKARLGNNPERSVFGARMAFDHFEALAGIPTTTPTELRAAADMVLNHDVTSREMKDKVRKVLEGKK